MGNSMDWMRWVECNGRDEVGCAKGSWDEIKYGRYDGRERWEETMKQRWHDTDKKQNEYPTLLDSQCSEWDQVKLKWRRRATPPLQQL